MLSLADDDRLVEQIRRGNEAAFEVVFERYGASILGFCRHMLGSNEEAEDAVQHTFASAHRNLCREDRREIAVKPWLYAIARNRCLSMLRARREQPAEIPELATAGLAEEVQHRADLRDLLGDLRKLPDDQRAALLLAELGALSHAEVADVLGCEVPKVKALVFRARSGLIARREARETPCGEIREQLANLSGGALRRSELRHHLSECAGCREYREQVKQQRQLLAAALPVVPALGLKKSVLAAVGIGGGAAGGGGALVGAGGVGALFSSLGAATATKVAVVGALAAGGAVTGTAVVEEVSGTTHRPAAFEQVTDRAVAKVRAAERAERLSKTRATPATVTADAVVREKKEHADKGAPAGENSVSGDDVSAERQAGARGIEQSAGHSEGRHLALARGINEAKDAERHGRRQGGGQRSRDRLAPESNGTIEVPATDAPVNRGPVVPRPHPAPGPKKPAPIDVEQTPAVEAPAPQPEATTETAPLKGPASGKATGSGK